MDKDADGRITQEEVQEVRVTMIKKKKLRIYSLIFLDEYYGNVNISVIHFTDYRLKRFR